MVAKTFVGATFGDWTVVDAIPGVPVVRCRCVCGVERDVPRGNLTRGFTKSCGCGRDRRTSDAMTKHGMFGTPTYYSWSSMLTRCTNAANKSFANYGARGIGVCDRWRSFENFLADMGEKPVGKSIDRINNDGNYEPANCRWATPLEQARNRRARRGKDSATA